MKKDSDQLRELLEKRTEELATTTGQLLKEIGRRQKVEKQLREYRDFYDEFLRVYMQQESADFVRPKILKGLLTVCAPCKKIKDKNNHWVKLETYIENHSEAKFTHSICPVCSKTLYPEIFRNSDE